MCVQNAAFDVIGMFGFGKDFKATLDLEGEGALACKALSEGDFWRENSSNVKSKLARACLLRAPMPLVGPKGRDMNVTILGWGKDEGLLLVTQAAMHTHWCRH